MLRKPDFASGLKAVWFGLVSLLLGPFALWFMLFAKMRRRNLLAHPARRNLGLLLGFAAFSGFLFLAPVHWAVLLCLYLAACFWSARSMARPDRARLFRFNVMARNPTGNAPEIILE
ncbi:MAG: hypothetical protein JWP91_38, partial [Fibrobacteres bacterium]|nr:hypothetical protein [Fibrobacterota bacterium]